MKQFPANVLGIAKLESSWLEGLGTTGDNVVPQILGLLPDGYVMEELEAVPDQMRSRLPTFVLQLLKSGVWWQDLPDISQDHYFHNPYWSDVMQTIFGVEPPKVIQLDAALKPCITHGDPSFSNIMRHPGRQTLSFIDPCHRNYAPMTWGVDAGKILQSCLGWEMLQADWDPPGYTLPDDPLFQDEYCLAVAVWWCGLHALRIERRERSSGKNRPEVLAWAEMVREECWRALDL